MSEWKSLKLSDIAYLSSDKIEMQDVGLNNYISTDNMLPDKSGVEPAIKLPSAKRVSHFEKGISYFQIFDLILKKYGLLNLKVALLPMFWFGSHLIKNQLPKNISITCSLVMNLSSIQ